MSVGNEHVARIIRGKAAPDTDYKQAAIESLAARWEHDDPEALTEALVWAVLHLASLREEK